MRIFLTGAHSTGKTTLATALSERLGLPLLPEVARAVLAKRGLTFPLPPELVDEVQREIYETQLSVFRSAPEEFISDRYFDCVAYWAVYSQKRGKIWTWVPRFNERNPLIFQLPPRRDLYVADDIRGASPFDDALRIDGALRMLYAERGLPVHHVKALTVDERVDEVLAVVRSPTRIDAQAIAKANDNPWRYFRKDGDNNIRRVRHGEEGTMFLSNGSAEYVQDLDWYLKKPTSFQEITEAEAAAILGGKPWEKSQ